MERQRGIKLQKWINMEKKGQKIGTKTESFFCAQML